MKLEIKQSREMQSGAPKWWQNMLFLVLSLNAEIGTFGSTYMIVWVDPKVIWDIHYIVFRTYNLALFLQLIDLWFSLIVKQTRSFRILLHALPKWNSIQWDIIFLDSAVNIISVWIFEASTEMIEENSSLKNHCIIVGCLCFF